jgi:chromosome partitioning protein
MRTIAIVNQKGGCGKTTVSINLASTLAKAGRKTLLVDMDPQGHCAVGLAIPEEQIEQSICDVLISTADDRPMHIDEVLWEISEGLELAPASIDLAALEQQMAGVAGREDCLKKVLAKLDGKYEFIVIDCPPAVGLLTLVALRAATDVIVPAETGYFSLHGLSRQLDTLSILCKQCNQQLSVKVLASMYDIRTKMAREILSELRKLFGDRMFKTVVNFNTKLKEAASLGQPISEYDPVSKGYKDFQALVTEIVGEEANGQTKAAVDTLHKQLEAISSSAEQLLASVTPAPAPSVQKKEVEAVAVAVAVAPTLEEKLADFYGSKQVGEAVIFSSLYPRATAVQVAGDFNGWKPEAAPMSRINENGMWQINLPLAKGRYRYRLVVDGQWQQDPYNTNAEMNPYGECNSVIEVC